LRLTLGLVAGLICTGYVIALPGAITTGPTDMSILFNGASMALFIYLFSYYVIKYKYKTMVEKPQKLATTGIGIYLLSWIVLWVLLYSILTTG